MRIDRFSRRGPFYLGVGCHAHNAIAAREYAHCRRDAKIARIEQSRVTNDEIARRNVCELMREPTGPYIVSLLLSGLQLRDRRFVLSWDNREPARY